MSNRDSQRKKLAEALTGFGFRSRAENPNGTFSPVPVYEQEIIVPGNPMGNTGIWIEEGEVQWYARLYRRNDMEDAHLVECRMVISRCSILHRNNLLRCDPNGSRRWEVLAENPL